MAQEAHDPTGTDLAEFLAPFWSTSKVRAELGIDTARLDGLASAGKVLALRDVDGAVIFPVDQFERVEGHVRVKPQIAAIISGLGGADPWSVAVLLRTPDDQFGTSPYDAARAGISDDDLAAFVRQVRFEWRV